ncbi:hypothetical protein WR25_10612 [Diploscapter pachys]|uniref:Uncharacterized protein n=1 Tax=Diploscapter pachys TaxID=2018661 RepID=A0A2A2JFR1_9BILA|nr:hypothetical protein WR25_10612 [Diploscapter pachys]
MSGLTECARRRSVEEERGRVDHDMHLSLYASAAAAAAAAAVDVGGEKQRKRRGEAAEDEIKDYDGWKGIGRRSGVVRRLSNKQLEEQPRRDPPRSRPIPSIPASE